jgi:hypothetical protein
MEISILYSIDIHKLYLNLVFEAVLTLAVLPLARITLKESSMTNSIDIYEMYLYLLIEPIFTLAKLTLARLALKVALSSL